ncbi:MAG: PQQ-like beta-propeller repeat protein, partial [Anaerolineae bacterium]
MRKQQPVPKGALALFLLVAIAFLGGCGGRSRSTTWTEMLVSDGVIYAADLDQVHALEAESGEVLWSFPPEPDSRSYGPFHTVTLLPGEALFVTSQERVGSGFFAQPQGILRALSIEGNRVLWEFRETRGEYAAGGAVANGILVIGNSDGNVYAISVEDGSLAWDSPFSTGNRVWSTPLIISDTVYVASMDHHLYALDLASGRERWERPFEAEGAMIGRPLALNDRFYVGAFDHKLYAV